MKLRHLIIAVLGMAVLLASCVKEPATPQKEEAASVTVSPTVLAFTEKAGSTFVTLTTNCNWTAESDSDWATVNVTSGGVSKSGAIVTVVVQANKGKERTATVTFTGKSAATTATAALKITQEASSAGSQGDALGAQNVTVSQFMAKPVDEKTWYRITGTITQICDSSEDAYGNFYIKDETGEVFVYGMTKEYKKGKNDQSFSQLGLKEGDVLTFVTLRSEYHGEVQAGGNSQPAFYESHTPGTAPARKYSDFTAEAADQPWMELPATSAEDDYLFLHHTMYLGSQETRSYSLYWDHHNMVARWVAYPLYRKAIGYGTRSDRWGLDPLLKREEQPVLATTYTSSDGKSYDRGHQIPSADRLSFESNVKTFYFTNMTPQLNDLNGALWSDLENTVRIWAKRSETDTLYVVTGCTVDDSKTFVKDNDGKQVTVPTHYYKALLRVYQGNYNAIGFWVEHRKYSNNKVDKSIAVSIDRLEELTGEDFFHNLPDAVETNVESTDPASDSWWWANMGN